MGLFQYNIIAFTGILLLGVQKQKGKWSIMLKEKETQITGRLGSLEIVDSFFRHSELDICYMSWEYPGRFFRVFHVFTWRWVYTNHAPEGLRFRISVEVFKAANGQP